MSRRAVHAPSAPDVLIVARSGRALAQAARAAGYRPYVIDLFGDVDTQVYAHSATRVAATAAGNFVAADLQAISGQVAALYGPLPLVCGSGFESSPRLLARLLHTHPSVYAPILAYQRLLDPPALWRRLHRLGVCVPPTLWRPTQRHVDWLVKRAATSGGAHVRRLTGSLRKNEYVQRFIVGDSLSALFLSNGRQTRLCGMAQHWRWAPTMVSAHWRYEGACSLIPLPRRLAAQARAAGQVVAAELGLHGGFGLDFIRDRAGRLHVVDINPRLPATLDLYANAATIFAAHVRACTAGALLYSTARQSAVAGQLVIYAAGPWAVPAVVAWPRDCADRPQRGTQVAAGEPLCTLLATASAASVLRTTLQRRYRALQRAIGPAAASVLPSTINIRTRGGSDDGRP